MISEQRLQQTPVCVCSPTRFPAAATGTYLRFARRNSPISWWWSRGGRRLWRSTREERPRNATTAAARTLRDTAGQRQMRSEMLSSNTRWAVRTSEVERVTLLDCSGGLDDAAVQASDQGQRGGSLGPADRVAVRPVLNRILQDRWDTQEVRKALASAEEPKWLTAVLREEFEPLQESDSGHKLRGVPVQTYTQQNKQSAV